MAKMSVIAHPYARALFNLAKETKQENKWLDLLLNLHDIVNNKDFTEILNDPKIDQEQIIFIFKSILNENFLTEVSNLLTTLFENKRILALADIYTIYRDLILEDQKRGDAIIESAFTMSKEEQLEFEKILSKKLGKEISTTIVINSKLIAGIKITINDKIIDGSIKGRINNLSTQLKQ